MGGWGKKSGELLVYHYFEAIGGKPTPFRYVEEDCDEL